MKCKKKEQKNELPVPGKLSLEKERLLYTSYFRCEWSMWLISVSFLVPCMLSLGAGAAPGVSIDLVADFQYLRTAYAIDTNLKFSDNLFAALSRFP